MIADLEVLEKTAQEDQSKKSDDRRVTRIESIKDTTQFDSSRFKLNLFSLVGYENEILRSTSNLTLMPSRAGEQNLNLFQLGTDKKVKYDWLSLWGEKILSSSNLVIKTDDNYNLKTILGNRWSRSYRGTCLKEHEFTAAKELLIKSLPIAVSSQLQWPAWNTEKG